jgi:hypothetical protein
MTRENFDRLECDSLSNTKILKVTVNRWKKPKNCIWRQRVKRLCYLRMRHAWLKQRIVPEAAWHEGNPIFILLQEPYFSCPWLGRENGREKYMDTVSYILIASFQVFHVQFSCYSVTDRTLTDHNCSNTPTVTRGRRQRTAIMECHAMLSDK